jgi:hypothetical protein
MPVEAVIDTKGWHTKQVLSGMTLKGMKNHISMIHLPSKFNAI